MSTPIVRRRKKPVEVDTIQWTGSNEAEVIAFTGGNFLLPERVERIFSPEFTAKVYDSLHGTWVRMKTGQHVVRGVQGEFYPIAEDVLAETYELVEEATAEAATATPDTLTDAERAFLTFALDLAADRMLSRSDEFTTEDDAALKAFRRMARGGDGRG